MRWLSEDPWIVVGALGLVALGFLVALWMTQQGKYLTRALIALGLAGLVLVIEWLWVTDRERIEAVVYDLARAVKASDAEGVARHLTPEATVSHPGGLLDPSPDVESLQALLSRLEFDMLRVSHLRTHAGQHTRRGTAEFRVMVSGTFQLPYGPKQHFAPMATEWSLGFREINPGQWQVDRITPTRLTREAATYFYYRP